MNLDIATLTDSEIHLFDDEWVSFFKYHYRHNYDVWDIFEEFKAVAHLGCEIAKHDLGLPFGGGYARSKQFGWAPLVPGHLNLCRTREITDNGTNSQWVNWIGSRNDPFITPKGVVILMFGVTNTDQPITDVVCFGVDGEEYPIQYLATLEREHQCTAKFPSPIFLRPGRIFYMETHAFKPGHDTIQPIGITFATTTYLRDLSRALT